MIIKTMKEILERYCVKTDYELSIQSLGNYEFGCFHFSLHSNEFVYI